DDFSLPIGVDRLIEDGWRRDDVAAVATFRQRPNVGAMSTSYDQPETNTLTASWLTTRRFVPVVTFVGAVCFALLVRGRSVVGIGVLFLVFVPLEKAFALQPQRVFRRGLLTDLTHLLVNSVFV